MKKFASVLAVAGILSIGSIGQGSAPTYLETFELYDGTFNATGVIGFSSGTTSIVEFQAGTASQGDFGGGDLSITATSPFRGTKALTWQGNADKYALVRGAADFASAPVLSGTAGQVYAAFAVRVDSLDATLGNNDIEIFRLGQDAGFRDIHVGVLDGVLELVGTNGGTLVNLSTEAFDPGSLNNWADNTWRVLALSATFDTAAANSVIKVWEIEDDGNAVLMGETAPFQATRNGGINHYGYGAFVNIPTGTAAVQISTDEWGIYDASTLAGESAFLDAVAEHYWNITPSSVNAWEMYN